MTRIGLAIGLLLALGGCTADADGDGISNKDEAAAGTDPKAADSDGDGLDDAAEIAAGADPLVADSDGDGVNDGDEIAAGSDPTKTDSDGDGYDDGVEIAAGSDPADASSMVYTGGWPFNGDKDDIEDPGFTSGGGRAGNVFARFVGSDQHKEDVDIYDFANQGTPLLIDVSAEWCPPCQAMASWLAGQEGGDFNYFEGQWGDVRTAVNQGKIRWITILGERNSGDPAGPNTPVRWDEEFPNHNIPVLADSDYVMASYINLRAWPSAMLVKENMEIDVYNRNDWASALDAAQYLIDQGEIVLDEE